MNKITRIYASLGRKGNVNHISIYRGDNVESRDHYPVSNASSARIQAVLFSNRVKITSVRASIVSGLCEVRGNVVPRPRVVIEVLGGVASIQSCPEDIEVAIEDYDLGDDWDEEEDFDDSVFSDDDFWNGID